MSPENKLKWLRYTLGAKVVFCFFIWGLPCLLAPVTLIQQLGISTPDDLFFMRLSGGFILSFGVAYWYAYRDPVQNGVMVKVGIIDNAMATLVMLYFVTFHDLRSLFMLVSMVLTFVFFLAFVLFMPKSQPALQYR